MNEQKHENQGIGFSLTVSCLKLFLQLNELSICSTESTRYKRAALSVLVEGGLGGLKEWSKHPVHTLRGLGETVGRNSFHPKPLNWVLLQDQAKDNKLSNLPDPTFLIHKMAPTSFTFLRVQITKTKNGYSQSGVPIQSVLGFISLQFRWCPIYCYY